MLVWHYGVDWHVGSQPCSLLHATPKKHQTEKIGQQVVFGPGISFLGSAILPKIGDLSQLGIYHNTESTAQAISELRLPMIIFFLQLTSTEAASTGLYESQCDYGNEAKVYYEA